MIKLHKVMSTPYNSEPNIDLPDGIYYPFQRLPGVMLVTYAFECIEVALKHALKHEQEDKQAADCIAAYQTLVQSWDLPGCRARICEMAKHKEDFATWRRSFDETVSEGKPLSDWPWEWAYSLVKLEYNADFHELVKHAYSFVLRAFNRKLDIENQTPKILPERSPLWLATIVQSLVVNYLPYSEVGGPTVLADESVIDFAQFQAELPIWPGPRPERQSKKAIRQTLKREGYRLKHHSVIRKGAEMWYKCRVSPGSIEEYLDEVDEQARKIDISHFTKNELRKCEKAYYPSRSNIEAAIAPYDQATAYPRKWRK